METAMVHSSWCDDRPMSGAYEEARMVTIQLRYVTCPPHGAIIVEDLALRLRKVLLFIFSCEICYISLQGGPTRLLLLGTDDANLGSKPKSLMSRERWQVWPARPPLTSWDAGDH
jgi:hypothetical protein